MFGNLPANGKTFQLDTKIICTARARKNVGTEIPSSATNLAMASQTVLRFVADTTPRKIPVGMAMIIANVMSSIVAGSRIAKISDTSSLYRKE